MGDVRRDLRLAVGEQPFDLASVDPAATPHAPSVAGSRDKHAALDELHGELGTRLGELHDLLIANDSNSVLLVLQGLDASGKSGTVRHVMSKLNPAGVRVTSFKAPTEEEAAHHFLWRIRKELPDAGEVVVFDRSHYEDLIVPLATGELDAGDVADRAREVNDFEHELVSSGTVVVKCLLHLSYDEQRDRLLRRLERPDKRWKFDEGDLDTRAAWDDFQAAYGRVASLTSTEHAPWHVIPADRKWYRNWAVANILADTLDDFGLTYPEPELDIAGLRRRLRPPA